MLYDIGLTITHEYASPVSAGRHALRLMPANIPGEQRLISGRLDIRPAPDERQESRDFFGNDVVDIAYRSSHAEIVFKVEARVERLASAPGLDLSPPLAGLAQEIASVRSLAPAAPHHFLGASARVPLDADITAYGREALRPGMTVAEAVAAIGKALHRDMTFDAEATTVDTPTREAFDRRHGVCQDFSHVMITALRGIGIPAGYVSGYLRTIPPKGKQRLEGSDAMHAWVRAWSGADSGWIEYDPTNAMLAGNDHIAIARGRDYSDVAPVKGVLRTAGGQTADHAVDVIPLTKAGTAA